MLGGKPVLRGLSLDVEQGEVFVIVGSSGVGKSVTLKHMVRLLTPDDGDIVVDGQSIVNLTGEDLERLRQKFGYLFQGGALLAWLSVFENVALPLRERSNLEEEEIARRVDDTLDMVGLADAAEQMPAEISGGMRKRAGLARAIVEEPKIILYDEPTSGLDPVTARTIDRLIDRMRKELGVTSVVVTHDLQSALSIGSRIAMLHEGTISELSEPAGFIKSPREEVQAFLESQFITAEGSWEKELP